MFGYAEPYPILSKDMDKTETSVSVSPMMFRHNINTANQDLNTIQKEPVRNPVTSESVPTIYKLSATVYQSNPSKSMTIGVRTAVNMPLSVRPRLANAPYLVLRSMAADVPTA